MPRKISRDNNPSKRQHLLHKLYDLPNDTFNEMIPAFNLHVSTLDIA